MSGASVLPREYRTLPIPNGQQTMADPKILNVVLCGIMNDGKLLLIKRRKAPYVGHWGLVGGKMEHGETVAGAAEREALEETQLSAKFDRVKGVVNENLINSDRIVAHFVIFVCRLTADETGHVASEEGELRWFTPEQIAAEESRVIPTDFRMIHTMVFRAADDVPFAEASMREADGRYAVLRFEKQ